MKLNKVKEIRLQRELTQEQLAEEVGCCKKIIDEIEVGNVTTGFIIAYRIAIALSVDIAEVFPLEYKR